MWNWEARLQEANPSVLREISPNIYSISAKINHSTMFCLSTICFQHEKLKSMLHEKCPLCASKIFIDIPSDIMLLARIAHTWNSTEYTPEFTGIPPHIIIMSYIEGLKHEIKSLKGTIINQLQDEIYKRVFYSMDHSTNHWQNGITKNIYHGRNSGNTDVLTSKVTEGSGTNGSNLNDIAVEEE